MNSVYVEAETKDLELLVEDVVHHCIQSLMPRMQTLDITVSLTDDFNDHQFGACLAVDTREFEIEVNKNLSRDDLITTICHEMVHVKQYARRQTPVDGTLNYKTYDEYENQWHEKEAFEMEKVLSETYKKL
jgi:folate-dependent tRNA-U54 methylase TrmFO/GidA